MGKTLTYDFAPDFISPPGETLEDILEERGMSQAELAERIGRTTKTVNEIVKGKAPIVPETALQLEHVLNIPARFWISREQQYREALARQEERKYLESCLEWIKSLPVNKMAELGWVKKTQDSVDQIRELLKFFAVASPEEWRKIWLTPAARTSFRKSLTFTSEPGAVSAWLRFGEIEARRRRCSPYDAGKFKSSLHQIRELTREPATVFQPVMIDLCCKAGVAVVLTPELPKARICGATRWLSPELALIQLSLRYKRDDHFWFTFFHEAGHILLHGKRDVFLEDSDDDKEKAKEEEANEFAANYLIPQSRLNAFIAQGERSHTSVLAFADQLGIAPGIVVGQLQKRGYTSYAHLNSLKRRFEWRKPEQPS